MQINERLDVLGPAHFRNLSLFPGFKVGTFDSSGSTGAQSITGIGFTPRLIILGYGAGDTSDFLAAFGWGTALSTVSVFAFRANAAGDGGGRNTTTGALLEICNQDGGVTDDCSLTSMDKDGFTINWAHAAAVRTIGYLAVQ